MRGEKFSVSLGEGKERLGPRFPPLPPVLYHSSGKSTYSEVTEGTRGLPASGIATVLCFWEWGEGRVTWWVGGGNQPSFAQLPRPPDLGERLTGQGEQGGARSGLSTRVLGQRGAHLPRCRDRPGRPAGERRSGPRAPRWAADGPGDCPEQPRVRSGSPFLSPLITSPLFLLS